MRCRKRDVEISGVATGTLGRGSLSMRWYFGRGLRHCQLQSPFRVGMFANATSPLIVPLAELNSGTDSIHRAGQIVLGERALVLRRQHAADGQLNLRVLNGRSPEHPVGHC